MTSLLWRSCGPSPSTWSQWPSCRSSSWSARPGRRRPSPPTTCSSWASTAPCTSSTGSGASTSRASSTSSPWWPASSRPSCTATSSTCTSRKFSRERSSVCPRKCQRPPAASVLRVLGQNSYHSKGSRCLMRKIGNSALLLRIVISGSVRTQRERTRRFLFNASCLTFFYYYVQRFFYTKELNAVLIKSVCSFNWG